jgi:hypothetical protein
MAAGGVKPSRRRRAPLPLSATYGRVEPRSEDRGGWRVTGLPAVAISVLVLTACGGQLGPDARAGGAGDRSGPRQADAIAHNQLAPAKSSKRVPHFLQECGEIMVRGRALRVDIVEGNRQLVTCLHGRKVMQRFLRTRRHHFRSRAYGGAWECYKSRQDGLGWDYHCNTFPHYVDVGAGRRW